MILRQSAFTQGRSVDDTDGPSADQTEADSVDAPEPAPRVTERILMTLGRDSRPDGNPPAAGTTPAPNEPEAVEDRRSCEGPAVVFRATRCDTGQAVPPRLLDRLFEWASDPLSPAVLPEFAAVTLRPHHPG